MDWSPPGFSVHGVFEAKILKWVAISSSSGSSWPRDWTHVFCISYTGKWILYYCTTWEAPYNMLAANNFWSTTCVFFIMEAKLKEELLTRTLLNLYQRKRCRTLSALPCARCGVRVTSCDPPQPCEALGTNYWGSGHGKTSGPVLTPAWTRGAKIQAQAWWVDTLSSTLGFAVLWGTQCFNVLAVSSYLFLMSFSIVFQFWQVSPRSSSHNIMRFQPHGSWVFIFSRRGSLWLNSNTVRLMGEQI